LVGKRLLVNVQPQIPVLHARVAGYFSQAVWWEKQVFHSRYVRSDIQFAPSANQGLYLALFPRANGLAEIIYIEQEI